MMPYDRFLGHSLAALRTADKHIHSVLQRLPAGEPDSDERKVLELLEDAQTRILQAVGYLLEGDWRVLWDLMEDTTVPKEKP